MGKRKGKKSKDAEEVEESETIDTNDQESKTAQTNKKQKPKPAPQILCPHLKINTMKCKSFKKNNEIPDFCKDCKAEEERRERSNKNKHLLPSKVAEKHNLYICLSCCSAFCDAEIADHVHFHNVNNKRHFIFANISTWECKCINCGPISLDNIRAIDVKVCIDALQDKIIEEEQNENKPNKVQYQRPQQQRKQAQRQRNEVIQERGRNKGKQKQVPNTIGIKGLQNLGNSCFFNSVLQCLSQTMPLLQYSIPELWNSTATENKKASGPLAQHLHHTLAAMWSIGNENKGNIFAPRQLMNTICQYAKQFSGRRQQDAQELLRCLLDNLIEEEKKVRVRVEEMRDKLLLEIENMEEELKKERLELLKKCENSLVPKDSKTEIEKIFQGTAISIITCHHCGHQKIRREEFLDLSLPIPTRFLEGRERAIFGNNNKRSYKQQTSIIPNNRPLSKKEKRKRKQQEHQTKENTSRDNTNENDSETTADTNSITKTEQSQSDSVEGVGIVDTQVNKTKSDIGFKSLNDKNCDIKQHNQSNPTDLVSDAQLFSDKEIEIDIENQKQEDNNDVGKNVASDTEENENNADNNQIDRGRNEELDKKDGDEIKDSEAKKDQDDGNEDSDNNDGDEKKESKVVNDKDGNETLNAEKEDDENDSIIGERIDNDDDENEDNEDDSSSDVDYNQLTEEEKAIKQYRDEILEKLKLADLNMEEEDKKYLNKVDLRSNVSYSNICDLDACLYSYTDCEVLDGDNKVECYSCTRRAIERANLPLSILINTHPDEEKEYWQQKKIQINTETNETQTQEIIPTELTTKKAHKFKLPLLRRTSTKQYVFKKLPPILTIHLKRFYHTGNGGVKIGKFVQFPKELDISPYCILEDLVSTKEKETDSEPQENENEQCMYRLYAVCVHSGGLNSGHYIARTLSINKEGGDRGQWYYFSDQSCHYASEEEVLKEQAYVLFYEKI